MKPKRFFYHYYKQKKKMSIHWNKSCHVVDNVVCEVPCETKWNKRQPQLVMRGWAKELVILDGVGYIR
jgi:hypothetical protein